MLGIHAAFQLGQSGIDSFPGDPHIFDEGSPSPSIRAIRGVFHTSQSDIIRLGQRIGAGAEGEVYEIQDRSDLVAKVYHEPPPPEKAEKLVVLSRLGNERLFNFSAWPVSTLFDGEVIGFVMKKISQAEEVHTLHSPKSRLQKFPEASWAFLIYVAANIARAVAAVHEHGIVIGDLNPKNILVTRKATVYLLDVDSFQVSVGGKTYRCEGGFPEYTPPELQGVAFRDVDRSQGHDCFGLAVVIFQLLFMGRHPFSGSYLGAEEMPLERAIRESRFAYGADAEEREIRQPPGTLALDSMPLALIILFRRAFLTTDRPRPHEWVGELDALAKALKKCDLHSGHYYYREAPDCPWCGIESQARVRLFNFVFPGADSRRGHFRLDEVWREITSVETPQTSLINWGEMKQQEPSAEVAAIAKDRESRLPRALIFSVVAGLAMPLLLPFPLAIFMLIVAGIVASIIAEAKAPPLEYIQVRQRLAEEKAQCLQEQYNFEAGNGRWGARLDELRKQKETYENLAQIRRLRLQELEDFDPTRCVSHETRVRIESEVESLRIRLESELSVGAQLLRRIKWEIETNRQILLPDLTLARRELAQAEKDLEVASKHDSSTLALIVLVFAFLLGWVIDLNRSSTGAFDEPAEAHRENSGIQPPPASMRDHGALTEQEKELEALKHYREGVKLSQEEKFAEAVEMFREAVEIYPGLKAAYEELGYTLSRLKRYEESIQASDAAIRLSFFDDDFKPYYNLGLVHFERENWPGAVYAFRYIVNKSLDPYPWKDEYTEAYYHLGFSLAKAGDLHDEIQVLETDWRLINDLPIKRFELATFYLCAGRRKSAKKQYQLLLENGDFSLAEELLKLMKKYG